MITLLGNPTRTASSLDQFDLLPPSFRYQTRVRQVFRSWLAIVVVLTTVLLGVIAATVFRSHRDAQMNKQIASAAIPLLDLRRDMIELQENNDRRTQWCRWVEAARPDDSALQTLAAIALASQNGNRQIIVDSIHLRLPIEYPQSAASRPDWATPQLTISARPATRDAAQGWVDRLNSFDRVHTASIVTDENKPSPRNTSSMPARSETAPVRLTAIPRATRVMP